ncbi:PTS sugar transporter subunit IIA [Lactobacillus jensenii]|uniref:PTS sugar transporter subunit IIA n=1 Tax=Lactobacillus jensenii TaxID=109790 RepID=UPI001430E227|nr:PTS sugar transporter subunit IIA [Lactobacillus jensenii]MDK6811575.1 PTS sugar transporter subunit IIA [Lactobacillus jensenii]MDK8615997.1 PTS sugar transporter subunit IIA [Lactobacillus jensenii]NJJ52020.1 PTS sugar transporter subunit IIA [Lactobacillus jensenii]
MKYLVLVSHGGFADGLKTSLAMFAGDQINRVFALGLEPGTSADTFKEKVNHFFDEHDFSNDDQFFVLADIVGGSPLTTFTSVLSERGFLANSQIFGGTNLTMALTILVSMDAMDKATLSSTILSEAGNALEEFKVAAPEDDDDEI